MALRSTQDIEYCEKCEEQGLLGFAQYSCEAKRLNPARDQVHEYRVVFARDRDKILYTKSFRRLVHKSQIFFSADPSKYMTRLTHTLRVAQVAQTIARALRLNEDLAVAIALGHDIGHAPFGHLGEDVLREKMIDVDGFEHNEESVWVLMQFEELNLTIKTLEGILKHTRFDYKHYKKGREDPFKEFWVHGCTEQFRNPFHYFGYKDADGKLQFEKPASLEGQIVDLSDEIAYIAHDLVDLRDMGLVRDEDLPQSWRNAFGRNSQQRNIINVFTTQVVNHNSSKLSDLPDQRSLEISYPPKLASMVREIKDWEERIFQTKLCGQVMEAKEKIGAVFDYFEQYPSELEKCSSDYFKVISDYYGQQGKKLVGHCIATMTDFDVGLIYNNITEGKMPC